MKKVIIAIVGLVLIFGLCYGMIWYFNEDKKVPIKSENGVDSIVVEENLPDNTSSDKINDRFTPYENTVVEPNSFADSGYTCLVTKNGFDANKEYSSKIYIEDGKVYFENIFDLKTLEAKGIDGNAIKIIEYETGKSVEIDEQPGSRNVSIILVLTSKNELYMSVLEPNAIEGCETQDQIDKLITFKKFKTSKKIIDITIRNAFYNYDPGYGYGPEELYLYLDTLELRKLELVYKSNDSLIPSSAKIGKRWGEMFPQLDFVYSESLNYIEDDIACGINVYDDKSISLGCIEYDDENSFNYKNIDLLYNNQKIKIKFIYSQDEDSKIYIIDEFNNLYKIEVDKLDYNKKLYDLVLIDKYDKIEINKNKDTIILTKSEKTETININHNFYKFYLRTDYESIY